jgi:hypothetical protein
LFAYKRWNDVGAVVIVVANLNDTPAGEFSIANIDNGPWHEQIFNYDATVADRILKDVLGPSEVKIYSKK